MSNSQQLQQTQQMRLQQRINPRQVALGRVLEMSVPEFDEEIRRRLDENPALTTADGCSNDSHDSHDDIASENTARTDITAMKKLQFPIFCRLITFSCTKQSSASTVPNILRSSLTSTSAAIPSTK